MLDALLAAGAPAVAAEDGRAGHPLLLAVGPARAALEAGGTLRDATAGAHRVNTGWADATVNLNTPADWRTWRRSTAAPSTR